MTAPDVVYAIVNEEPNAEEMKAKVKAYEEANKSQIVIRQSQRADEERSIADRCVDSRASGIDVVYSSLDTRIAAEQREAERRKREAIEEERAIALTKRKYKQEAAEVLLGVSDSCLCRIEISC